MGQTLSDVVSIIIPTRNRAGVLAQCLAALAEQQADSHPHEIVVVDDCSSDRTQEIVVELARTSSVPVRLIRQPTPLGANAARNRGLDASGGPIVAFVDDDVVVPQGWLEKLLLGLQRSGYPVVSGAVRVAAEGPILGKHRQELQAYLGEVLAAPTGVDGETVPISCNMAARRWVFKQAKFDPVVRPPVEEVDWLRRAGVKAGFVPEAWVWHLKGGDELCLRRMLRGAWRRGNEGGWWLRERYKAPRCERRAMALCSLRSSARAFGHAILQRCWGGAIIGLGELARALALVGLINRGPRRAESWR